MELDQNQEKLWMFMRTSIDAGKQSKNENEEIKPKVGAVLVKDDEIIGVAHRGELGKGDHAEYTLLEKKLKGINCVGATLFTTLEPCTTRQTKTPCCDWIIERGIKKVYVGMYDPNILIFGKGFAFLRSHNIEVYEYPPELRAEIENDNFDFIQYCKLANNGELKSLEDLPYSLSPHYRTLDDWYHIINRIYFDKNFAKDEKLLFSHLVEILGGLSVLSTSKNKNINPSEQIAKALAWWLVLCGKMGIRSVVDLIFNKFPNVCPYCLSNPHNEDECLQIKDRNEGPNWEKLLHMSRGTSNRPYTLASFQQMFYSIYPVSQNEDFDKVLGRFTEEIGELAEAIRVFKVAPTHFLSEAADVFAWLMHLNNLFETRNLKGIQMPSRGKLLEETLFKLYPDKCKDCDQIICNCPPVLKSTIGRISNDGPSLDFFELYDNPFMTKAEMAKEFDSGNNLIVVGLNQFDVNPKFIKTLYNFSKNLIQEIRNSLFNEYSDFNRIINSLQVINGFASTQRANQFSINRFLKYVFNLSDEEKFKFIKLIVQINTENDEFHNSLVKLITKTAAPSR